MKEFTEKVATTAKNVAKTTSEKACELIQLAKLNIKLKAKENELEEAYECLGKLCYDQITTSAENMALIDIRVDNVRKIKEEKEKIKKEISEIK